MALMSGAFFAGKREVELEEFPIPEPGYDQVLIRVKASGLCASDLPRYRAASQETDEHIIAGREVCGIIEEVGPGVQRFKVGDRVFVYPTSGCGLCQNCRSGWMVNCTSPLRSTYGEQRDGGHATFLLAEERTLIALPSELSYVDGALLAGEIGAAYAACCRAGISGRDTVLITGLEPLGSAIALLSRAMGARVIGMDSSYPRREQAQQLGFAEILATRGDMLATLLEKTEGRGFEVAIDCSGDTEARHLCLEAARPWGRVVFVGTGGLATFEPGPLLIEKQLTLYGSHACSLPQLEELAELLVRWHLHPEALVTERFPLSDVQEAYVELDSDSSGKVMLIPD